jgi:hypothetical protein
MAQPKAYVLNEAAARWLKGQVESRTGSEILTEANQFADGPLARVYFVNKSSETIPPHGVIRINGYTVSDGGRILVNAIKPASSLGRFLVNGPVEVEAGKVGLALNTSPAIVAYESGFTLSAGNSYGIDGWKINVFPTAKPLVNVNVLADYDATKKYCVAEIRPMQSILIKAPAGGIPGRVGSLVGAAICDLVYLETSNQQLGTSTVQSKIYNWSTSAACSTGDRYGVASRIDNLFLIVAEDCNDEGSTVSPGTGSGSGGTVRPAIDISTITPAVSTGQFYNVTFSGTGTGSGPA